MVKYSLIVAILLAIISQFEIVQNFIDQAADTTNSQVESGDDYIRVRTFDFLFNRVNVDTGSLIFGNGMPVESSEYGKLVLETGAERNGYISADLGLVGFAFNYGILSLLAFLNIMIVAILKKLPKDSIYLNIFFSIY